MSLKVGSAFEFGAGRSCIRSSCSLVVPAPLDKWARSPTLTAGVGLSFCSLHFPCQLCTLRKPALISGIHPTAVEVEVLAVNVSNFLSKLQQWETC